MRDSIFKVMDKVTKQVMSVRACTLRHAVMVAADMMHVPASRIILVEVSQ